jgi:hypothetical protein
MTDVELLDLRYFGDRAEISRSESVASVHRQLELGGEPGGFAQGVERCRITRAVGEVAGVKLDRIRTDRF